MFLGVEGGCVLLLVGLLVLVLLLCGLLRVEFMVRLCLGFDFCFGYCSSYREGKIGVVVKVMFF